MTFFNKKTEVMQIQMTPYGRYLYSIGKFMPHSYEFVDDDILYKQSGSVEAQNLAHTRIINETPKLKINRAFQDEAPVVQSPPIVDTQREMVRRMNMRQANLYPIGRSSHSSDQIPQLQVTMLQGMISGSKMVYEVSASQNPLDGTGSLGGNIFIPQIDIDLNFTVSLKNTLDPVDDYTGDTVTSDILSNGNYIEMRYKSPIIHIKEFNSFYEKENFDFETYEVTGSSGDEILLPLTVEGEVSNIVNNILSGEEELDRFNDGDFQVYGFLQEDNSRDKLEYFFRIETDEDIPTEMLCQVINSLEINSQFLDEELICPDQRTDRFDIYNTRVTPDDLEDCDWWIIWP